ncbi:hypothetical protein [Paractinoplanes rishiriensis]|uniref:Uncharacterized protein n=1 Tax=Paractinoplanes rishiriensis TaxID=1050105 RepID=A0A919K3Q4_9ACTN|nr:hypothetical protein [Actinoplanes rishiriensis]GIE98013.1 hypothetical protein Ari01nite_54780 [Actinoplanes rishiriensis]
MLTGIDEIDWASYQGAYGPATEAPDILRAMADRDPETAAGGMFDFGSSLWHQGTVFPVTVAVVPFLVELATTRSVHDRHHVLRILGAISDPAESDGPDQPAVRAAVAAHADRLLPLLSDKQVEVREAAAYTIAQCGGDPGDRLRQRWTAERNPQVRASLLMAIVHQETGGAADLLREAALSQPFPVPVAAALAAARAGLPLAPETLPPIAAAFAHKDEWDTAWSDGEVLTEVLELVDDETAAALVQRPAPARRRWWQRSRPDESPEARARSAFAMEERFRTRRSAPEKLMPRLRELLTDPDAEVRDAAAGAAANAGRAAAAVADELATLALGDLTEHRGAAQSALNTLVRLRDPRWREPLLAAWDAGREVSASGLLPTYPIPFDPEVFAAARRRLTALLAARQTGNPVIRTINVLRIWEPEVADALPELIAALPAAPWVTTQVLGSLGPAAADALPVLRVAARDGIPMPFDGVTRVRPAHALWRISGDPEPLVVAANLMLNGPLAGRHWELGLIAEAGPAMAPLVPRLTDILTGRAADTFPDRVAQVAAARVVWRATGEVLPILADVLRAGDNPVREAAALAAEIAAVTPGWLGDLAPPLRAALRGEWGRVSAARALWLLGTDPADLVRPLLAAIDDGWGDDGGVALLVEMDARGAAAGLRRLADRDERVVRHGEEQEPAWRDERLRDELRAAAATLSPAAQT